MPELPASPPRPAIRIAALVAALVPVLILSATWPANGQAATPVLDTVITSGPGEGELIEVPNVVFAFAATRDGAPFPGASFHCSVDYAPARPCSSPLALDPLAEGSHVFSVYAEDPGAFSVDPEPATRSFIVLGEEQDEDEACEEPADEEVGEEGEEGEFEDESEFCEVDEASGGDLPPQECRLRSARARVLVQGSRSRVRLVVRYTSFAPAQVRVDYRLAGSKGPLRLRPVHRHFARRGLFRVSEHLDAAEMRKARAAMPSVTVKRLAAAPRYCRRYDVRHLTMRRTVHDQIVWFQSDSIFGTTR